MSVSGSWVRRLRDQTQMARSWMRPPIGRPVFATNISASTSEQESATTSVKATAPRRNATGLLNFAGSKLYRAGGSTLRLARLLRGGRVGDLGRLPRYACILALSSAMIWVSIVVYVKVAPVKFTSSLALILPGAGVSTSLNLSDIGQASSSANSPYSSPSLSPTVLYKNLLESFSVIDRAAHVMHMTARDFGKPVVKLVDETSLIHFEMSGKTPEDAHDRAEAIHEALLAELEKLRNDEIKHREDAAIDSVRNYQESVDAVRAKISALQLLAGLNSADQYASIVTATEALQSRVAETDAALSEKESAMHSLSASLNLSSEMAMVTLKCLADPELTALSATAAKDGADLAALEKQLGPKHPKIRDARLRALGTRTRMMSRAIAISRLSPDSFRENVDMNPTGERIALMSKLITLKTERDGLAAQFRSQSEELGKTRTRVHDLVEVASHLDTLNRDYKVADAVFASALTRINTSKTDVFASYPMVQVAEPATMPESPSSPNKLIAVGAGAAATFFILTGLTLAWVRGPLIQKILAPRDSPHAAQ